MTDTVLSTPSIDGVATPGRSVGIAALFTVTAFIGASLLFVVQPMVARLVLPSFGGSSTVWSTSSLFFQVLLLFGYMYAHAATRRLGPRWHPPVHILVLLAPLVVLPIALPSTAAPEADTSPVLWLLRVLAVMIGLPFVVISTTGPLLQRWYSWSDGYRSNDPYFLFAAGNLGSFVGLLAYPFLVEPLLTLEQQRTGWSWGFLFFAGLTMACGVVTRSAARRNPVETIPTPPKRAEALDWQRYVKWTLLAFLPSAMMLAVTAHISTDIAPIPLLWVVPLAIYLGTFVIAFSRTSRLVPSYAVRLSIGFTFVAASAAMMQGSMPILVDVVLNLVMLGFVAFVAHARLAADRPGVAELTAFYLVLATGGALGGLLNGVLAPLVFDRVLEYPLIAILVPLVLVTTKHPRANKQAARARLTTRIAAVPIAVVGAVGLGVLLNRWADHVALVYAALALALLAGTLLSTRRIIVAVVLALMFTGVTYHSEGGALDHRRTFFGSYRVFEKDGQHQFAHGTTLHGTQWWDERRREPTAYYSRSGPLGSVFDLEDIRDVGVVGLGVGTIAAYGSAGQKFTFVEIDPEVVEVARDPALFTYLKDSKADISVTVGDGRLEVAKLSDASLDMLILDAFSSDAIPVHLLTTEAMQTYSEKLRPGGLLVVHISNMVFDLAPVLTGTAQALGWEGRLALSGSGAGATPSRWVVLSADNSKLDFSSGAAWDHLPKRSVTWTDDYSSIISVLR